MGLSKKQRFVFGFIILSFILGMFFFLLSTLLISQDIIRQAWVPEPVRVIRQAIIERPHSLQAELQAVSRPRNDVPLPASALMFDAGFRPRPDGFSFANYGSRFPEGNLTVIEAQELFGNMVCISGSGQSCLPSPVTQMWLDTMNDYMADGHCAGFTVASRRFFEAQLDQSFFTPVANVTFDVSQNVPVMRQIAQDWALQVTEEVWQARVAGTPREVVDALLARQEPVDLGIFGRSGGGHSLLAYGIEAKGDGIYHILVYDNNWPGQELYVEVDYRANSWQYALGAADPNQPAVVWEGDARTRSLMFIPFSVYDQPVTCPFCQAETDEQRAEFAFVSLTGDEALLQVSDEQGHRLGHFGDEFINEIEGARLIRLKDRMYNDREPYLALPQGLPFNVRVLPRPGQTIAQAHLRLGGAGFAYAVDGLSLAAEQFAGVSVSPDDQRLRYSSDGVSAPTLKLVVQQQQLATLAMVGDVTLLGDQQLNLTLDPATGQLLVSGLDQAPLPGSGGSTATGGSGSPSGTGPVGAQRPNPPGQVAGPLAERLGLGDSGLTPPDNSRLLSGAETRASLIIAVIQPERQPWIFIAPAIPYFPQGSIAFDLANWDGVGPISVRLDRNGDGVPEQSLSLENQPVAMLLGQQLSAQDIIISLGDLAVYLNDDQISQLLAGLTQLGQPQSSVETLTALGLDGDDIGEILYALNLSPAQRGSFIQGLQLPPDELAHLLFELNLSPAERAGLTGALDLPPEIIDWLQDQLETLDQVDQILTGWEIANLPPDQLPAFINEQPGLSPDQIGFLLDELDLDLPDLVDILIGLGYPDQSLTPIFYELNLTQAETTFVLEGIGQVTGQSTTWRWPPSVPLASPGYSPPPPPAVAVAPAPVQAPAASVSFPPPGAGPAPAAAGTVPAAGSPSPSSLPPMATSVPPAQQPPPPLPPPSSPSGDNDNDSDSDFDGGGKGSGSGGGGGSTPTPVPVNNPPLINPDNPIINEDTPTDIFPLANDVDPDGDPLLITSATAGSSGGVAISGQAGQISLSAAGTKITYTPNLNFVGNDSLNYTVSDGRGGTGSGQINISVVNINDPPVFSSTPGTSANLGTLYTYNITIGDPDPGDSWTFTGPITPPNPAWLTLADNGNGTAMLSGTPGAGDVGGNPVTLQVQDGSGLTDVQSFIINVSGSADLTLDVDRTDDTNVAGAQICDDAIPNDCSLRGAISKANGDATNAYTITVPAGTYSLAIAGTGEDGNATGDLDVTDSVTISGAGASSTIIDGNGLDRVFQIAAADVTFTIGDVTIQGGNPTGPGGGIYVTDNLPDFPVDITVEDAALKNNVASAGGGLYFNPNFTGSKLTLNRVEVSGNSVSDYGGGLFIEGAENSAINNSTISSNSADQYGGGLHMGGSGCCFGQLAVNYSTIAANIADADNSGGETGGGLNINSSVLLQSSIIADNQLGSGAFNDCNGSTLTSQDYNLIEDPAGCTIDGTITNNLTGLDPNLGPLQNNGGSTDTQALLAPSAAIDAIPNGTNGCGTTFTTDQRGTGRPINSNCDMGAYEAPPPPPPPPLTVNVVGFLGTSTADMGYDVFVDSSGNIYFLGVGDADFGSNRIPHTGPPPNNDLFVSKYNGTGTFQWQTYLGSFSNDIGTGLVVDGGGNVYVTGTSDAGWVGGGGLFLPFIGGNDAFVAKLDGNGFHQWNNFFGSATDDFGHDIAVDGGGNLYVTGTSDAAWNMGPPTVLPYSGGQDLFIAKFDANTGAPLWNAFLGSATNDQGWGIVTDGSGNVYLTGYSDATWGGPVNGHAGGDDAFAVKLNSAGAIQWHTFMGSGTGDQAYDLALDTGNNLYVTGTSDAPWGPGSGSYSGGQDAFMALLNGASGNLQGNNLFMGSATNDQGRAILFNPFTMQLYISGLSDAAWGSSTTRFYSGGNDIFVARVSALGGGVNQNTFLGSATQDTPGYGLAMEPGGLVYLTGTSDATWDAPWDPYMGGDEALFVRLLP